MDAYAFPDSSKKFPARCHTFPCSEAREIRCKCLDLSRKMSSVKRDSRLKTGISLFFPCLAGNWIRDRFAYDCAHHHPVFANRTFPIRLRIGRFCGDFRPLTSWILVSADVRAFLWRFWRSVSASKNSVPGSLALITKLDRTAPVIPTFGPP